MNTLTQSDLHDILKGLDALKELTDLLRRDHYTVPTREVYRAAAAEALIRERLFDAAITDVAVEPPPIRKLVPAVPASRGEVVF